MPKSRFLVEVETLICRIDNNAQITLGYRQTSFEGFETTSRHGIGSYAIKYVTEWSFNIGKTNRNHQKIT